MLTNWFLDHKPYQLHKFINDNEIEDMLRLTTKFRHDNKLYIKKCQFISPASYAKLFAHHDFKQLTQISIVSSIAFSDLALQSLSTLSSLIKLELENLKSITTQGLKTFFLNTQLEKLKYLKIRKISCMNNEVMKAICENSTINGLETIDFKLCKQFDDDCLITMANSQNKIFQNVIVFNLSGCKKITDKGILGFLKINFNSLQILKLSNLCNITSNSMMNFFQNRSQNQILNQDQDQNQPQKQYSPILSTLTELYLENCYLINNDFFIELLKSLIPKLMTLTLPAHYDIYNTFRDSEVFRNLTYIKFYSPNIFNKEVNNQSIEFYQTLGRKIDFYLSKNEYNPKLELKKLQVPRGTYLRNCFKQDNPNMSGINCIMTKFNDKKFKRLNKAKNYSKTMIFVEKFLKLNIDLYYYEHIAFNNQDFHEICMKYELKNIKYLYLENCNLINIEPEDFLISRLYNLQVVKIISDGDLNNFIIALAKSGTLTLKVLDLTFDHQTLRKEIAEYLFHAKFMQTLLKLKLQHKGNSILEEDFFSFFLQDTFRFKTLRCPSLMKLKLERMAITSNFANFLELFSNLKLLVLKDMNINSTVVKDDIYINLSRPQLLIKTDLASFDILSRFDLSNVKKVIVDLKRIGIARSESLGELFTYESRQYFINGTSQEDIYLNQLLQKWLEITKIPNVKLTKIYQVDDLFDFPVKFPEGIDASLLLQLVGIIPSNDEEDTANDIENIPKIIKVPKYIDSGQNLISNIKARQSISVGHDDISLLRITIHPGIIQIKCCIMESLNFTSLVFGFSKLKELHLINVLEPQWNHAQPFDFLYLEKLLIQLQVLDSNFIENFKKIIYCPILKNFRITASKIVTRAKTLESLSGIAGLYLQTILIEATDESDEKQVPFKHFCQSVLDLTSSSFPCLKEFYFPFEISETIEHESIETLQKINNNDLRNYLLSVYYTIRFSNYINFPSSDLPNFFSEKFAAYCWDWHFELKEIEGYINIYKTLLENYSTLPEFILDEKYFKDKITVAEDDLKVKLIKNEQILEFFSKLALPENANTEFVKKLFSEFKSVEQIQNFFKHEVNIKKLDSSFKPDIVSLNNLIKYMDLPESLLLQFRSTHLNAILANNNKIHLTLTLLKAAEKKIGEEVKKRQAFLKIMRIAHSATGILARKGPIFYEFEKKKGIFPNAKIIEFDFKSTKDMSEEFLKNDVIPYMKSTKKFTTVEIKNPFYTRTYYRYVFELAIIDGIEELCLIDFANQPDLGNEEGPYEYMLNKLGIKKNLDNPGVYGYQTRIPNEELYEATSLDTKNMNQNQEYQRLIQNEESQSPRFKTDHEKINQQQQEGFIFQFNIKKLVLKGLTKLMFKKAHDKYVDCIEFMTLLIQRCVKLESLELYELWTQDYDNDKPMRDLLHAICSKGLHELSIIGFRLKSACWLVKMLEYPEILNLKHLKIYFHKLKNEYLTIIAGSVHLINLTELKLRDFYKPKKTNKVKYANHDSDDDYSVQELKTLFLDKGFSDLIQSETLKLNWEQFFNEHEQYFTDPIIERALEIGRFVNCKNIIWPRSKVSDKLMLKILDQIGDKRKLLNKKNNDKTTHKKTYAEILQERREAAALEVHDFNLKDFLEKNKKAKFMTINVYLKFFENKFRNLTNSITFNNPRYEPHMKLLNLLNIKPTEENMIMREEITQIHLNNLLRKPEYGPHIDDDFIKILCTPLFISKINNPNDHIIIVLDSKLHVKITNVGLNLLIKTYPYLNIDSLYVWALIDPEWRSKLRFETIELILKGCKSKIYHGVSYLTFDEIGLFGHKFNIENLETMFEYDIISLRNCGKIILSTMEKCRILEIVELNGNIIDDKFCESLALTLANPIRTNEDIRAIIITNNYFLTYVGYKYLYTINAGTRKIDFSITGSDVKIQLPTTIMLNQGFNAGIIAKFQQYRRLYNKRGIRLYDGACILIVFYSLICCFIACRQFWDPEIEEQVDSNPLLNLLVKKPEILLEKVKKCLGFGQAPTKYTYFSLDASSGPQGSEFVFTQNCIELNDYLKRVWIWGLYLAVCTTYYSICLIFPAVFVLSCGNGHQWISHILYGVYAGITFFIEAILLRKVIEIIDDPSIIELSLASLGPLGLSQLSRVTLYTDLLFIYVSFQCGNTTVAIISICFLTIHLSFKLFQIIRILVKRIKSTNYYDNTHFINLMAQFSYFIEMKALAEIFERLSTACTIEISGNYFPQIILINIFKFTAQNLASAILQTITLLQKNNDYVSAQVFASLLLSVASLLISFYQAISAKPKVCTPEMIKTQTYENYQQYMFQVEDELEDIVKNKVKSPFQIELDDVKTHKKKLKNQKKGKDKTDQKEARLSVSKEKSDITPDQKDYVALKPTENDITRGKTPIIDMNSPSQKSLLDNTASRLRSPIDNTNTSRKKAQIDNLNIPRGKTPIENSNIAREKTPILNRTQTRRRATKKPTFAQITPKAQYFQRQVRFSGFLPLRRQNTNLPRIEQSLKKTNGKLYYSQTQLGLTL